MEINNLSKEELELMSYNDISYLLLKKSSPKTTVDLFKKICDLLGLTNSEYENKIGGFYTSLTTDKRFIMLDSGDWDLKENHSIKSLKIEEIMDDIEDNYIDEEEDFDDNMEDEIEEDSYDDNSDDDQDNIVEEYKDLVIVDEEDLENIE